MGCSQSLETKEPKSVTILGSTGSIGCNTIDLILANPELYQVEALTAYQNVNQLISQVRKLGARFAVIGDKKKYKELKEAASGISVELSAGPEGLREAARRKADWVMAGIVGFAGLEPTLEAVRQGTTIAFANKECLVCAGELFLAEVKRNRSTLLPVDSEHNAIFQVYDFKQKHLVDKIILTASGGPFRNLGLEKMTMVTPEEAIAHPNWSMGPKISVDSATMMNKGLEIIEAHHLFGVDEKQIEVLIHKESIIHSMVAYVDGSVLAQLGTADMRTPISYTLGWPERMKSNTHPLNLLEVGSLTFEKPDAARFPLLTLARDALRAGQSAPIILNAANEAAVSRFLARKLRFLDIARVVSEALEKISVRDIRSLNDVITADVEARQVAGEIMSDL